MKLVEINVLPSVMPLLGWFVLFILFCLLQCGHNITVLLQHFTPLFHQDQAQEVCIAIMHYT